MKNFKVILVAGARPNFMKIAPLIHAINAQNSLLKWGNTHINYLLVHTGQHYDLQMSGAFIRDLCLPSPDINLEVGSASHSVQTAEIMVHFEKVCLREKPDWVIVVGDVNSTMACALVAAKLGIGVAHVEAGLRNFDRSMPEEINRVVTDAVADLLFTPSEDADENLMKEGVSPNRIKRVGNIMIDTLLAHLDKSRREKPYETFGLKEKEYVYATLHRPSNVDNEDSLTGIMKNLSYLSAKLPIVFPVHPRTKKNLIQFGLWQKVDKYPGMVLSEPLGYHESIGLVEKASFVITDSGGLQEETTFLKVPCLTLRPSTERPITIKLGTNKLTSLKTLQDDIDLLLNGYHFSGKIPNLWDGKTGERIIRILTNHADHGNQT